MPKKFYPGEEVLLYKKHKGYVIDRKKVWMEYDVYYSDLESNPERYTHTKRLPWYRRMFIELFTNY